jgi:tetratricopeptide (TPR) repeat protein
LARELGVNYAVEGSVRKSGDRIRITAQLIDAKTGNHIWAERYDRESRDIFDVQDAVVSSIVVTLEGRLISASAAVVRRKPTANWNAYECFLQGRDLANEYREPEAVPFFARAVELDPNFACGHAWLAIARTVAFMGNSETRLIEEAAVSAERALSLDSNDPTVHHAAAMVRMWSGQLVEAGRHFDRAVALNPGDTQIRADRARWLHYSGRSDEGLAAIDDALKQGPFAPHWFWIVRGEILFDTEKYRDAIASLGNLPHKKVRGLIYLAAAHAQAGELEVAGSILAQASRLEPGIALSSTVAARPYANSSHPDHLLDGLRKAGWPE